MQFDNVDSKTTIADVLSNKIDVTEFYKIIAACQNTLSSCFTYSRVEFNRRQTNMVVYALAQEAIKVVNPIIYFEIFDCIAILIIDEML